MEEEKRNSSETIEQLMNEKDVLSQKNSHFESELVAEQNSRHLRLYLLTAQPTSAAGYFFTPTGLATRCIIIIILLVLFSWKMGITKMLQFI